MAQYDWLRSVVMRDKLFAVDFKISGRSAAWLARLVRDQEVGGSNPLAPTTSLQAVAQAFSFFFYSFALRVVGENNTGMTRFGQCH
jgi:hypothetical protein